MFHQSKQHEHSSNRYCDWQDCLELGAYRAPQAPDRLSTYYWFCLPHVRQYNSSWNYFAHMDEASIQAYLNETNMGYGSTRPMRGPLHIEVINALKDFYTHYATPVTEPVTGFYQALRVMNLSQPFSSIGLKARYKKLAKQYHPDVNKQDTQAAVHFQRIVAAYQLLKPWAT